MKSFVHDEMTDIMRTESGLAVAGAFGANGQAPQTAPAIGAPLASYSTGVFGLDSDVNMQALYTMVVAMRAALIANGTLKI